MRMARDERGFSAPVFVVMIAAMVMFLGGISVDLWRVLAEHRKVTNLADGASIAAATAVDLDRLYNQPNRPAVLDEPEAIARACDYLARNSVTASCPGEVVVTVAGDEVTIELRREVPLTLLAFLSVAGGNTDPIEVAAVSTAELQRGVP